jgi:hypothetical protein
MDERNPYAPPTAAVSDIDTVSTSAGAADTPFFAVTLFKYVLMFVCTLGLYQINAEVAPEQDRNGRLSWLNWIVVGLGGVIILLALLGTLAPAHVD